MRRPSPEHEVPQMTPARRSNGIGRARFALAAALLGLIAAGWLPARCRAFDDDEVRAIAGNVKQPSDFPGAGGVWMARQREVHIDGMGNATVTEHVLARVFDPAWGEARFRPYRRLYWNQYANLLVDRVRVWHGWNEFEDLPESVVVDSLAPQARGVYSCRYLRERRVQFPALKEGDVVELRFHWTLRSPLSSSVLRWLDEPFGDDVPVIEQQLITVTPEAMRVQIAALGPLVQHGSSPMGTFRRNFWISGNLPALTGPLVETPWSRLPAAGDTLSPKVGQILFSTVSHWGSVGRMYGELWALAWDRRCPDMDRMLAGLGVSGQRTEVVAAAVAKMIRDQIRTIPVDSGVLDLCPVDAALVAQDRAGTPRDKACLLVSLLRAAGVKAFPALVRTRRGPWNPDVPCADQLDRYLVRADVSGGQPIWLDPVGSREAMPAGRGVLFYGDGEGPTDGSDSVLVAIPPMAPTAG